MKVSIKFRHLPTNQDAEDYINYRLSFGLGRFSHSIEKVAVTLDDVNGPRGGMDQLCSLVIHIAGAAPVVIHEQQFEQEVAINRAISRAKTALKRRLKRRQVKQTGMSLKRHQFEAQDFDVASST